MPFAFRLNVAYALWQLNNQYKNKEVTLHRMSQLDIQSSENTEHKHIATSLHIGPKILGFIILLYGLILAVKVSLLT